jgi:hypothetical protein
LAITLLNPARILWTRLAIKLEPKLRAQTPIKKRTRNWKGFFENHGLLVDLLRVIDLSFGNQVYRDGADAHR